MTKEALKLALEWAETHGEAVFVGGGISAVTGMNEWAAVIKEALAQPERRNFCPRCGKRTPDLTTIHTCTPPRGLEMT